jgi:predicted HD phosphohydrolase
MYTAGALNTFIDDLSKWIHEKEAAIEKNRHNEFLAPVIADLQKHVEETRAALVKAERYLAEKERA